jgi:tRNA U34 5-methylaminomethyl-2-thiouridine-forming methyltransferase MnmC
MMGPVVPTADGSLTLWDERTGQHYHSLHGARRESEHVFIKNGLDPFLRNENLSILELGFGTGLNALLACKWAQKWQVPVRYLSYDLYPLDRRDFTDSADPSEKMVWNQLLDCPWGVEIRIHKYFFLKKERCDIRSLNGHHEAFNAVFHDAFSPDSEPKLWTLQVFQTMYSALQENGSWVSYSAKGQVRRDLQTAGFIVERLEGPPGKREMLRGWKK